MWDEVPVLGLCAILPLMFVLVLDTLSIIGLEHAHGVIADGVSPQTKAKNPAIHPQGSAAHAAIKVEFAPPLGAIHRHLRDQIDPFRVNVNVFGKTRAKSAPRIDLKDHPVHTGPQMLRRHLPVGKIPRGSLVVITIGIAPPIGVNV